MSGGGRTGWLTWLENVGWISHASSTYLLTPSPGTDRPVHRECVRVMLSPQARCVTGQTLCRSPSMWVEECLVWHLALGSTKAFSIITFIRKNRDVFISYLQTLWPFFLSSELDRFRKGLVYGITVRPQRLIIIIITTLTTSTRTARSQATSLLTLRAFSHFI